MQLRKEINYEDIINATLENSKDLFCKYQPWDEARYRKLDVQSRLNSIMTELKITLENSTNKIFKECFKNLHPNYLYCENHYTLSKKIEFLRYMLGENFIQPVGLLGVEVQRNEENPWLNVSRLVIPESTYIIANYEEVKDADVWDLVYGIRTAPFECWVRHTTSEVERNLIDLKKPRTIKELKSSGFVNYVCFESDEAANENNI